MMIFLPKSVDPILPNFLSPPRYCQHKLTTRVWLQNLGLFSFGILGFTTGTYASLVQIAAAFGIEDKI
jgi:hypothetical protein